MKPPNAESSCSKVSLLEFLDGELTAEQEQAVAAHIKTCPVCQIEIKQQRKLFAKLDDSLAEPPEIPADFSKIVSANARSQVSAIRRPYERRTAVLICFGLLMTALLPIVLGPLKAVLGPPVVLGKIRSVVDLAFSLLSDVALGFGIIGRAASASFGISPLILLGLVVGSVAILAVLRNQRVARSPGVWRWHR